MVSGPAGPVRIDCGADWLGRVNEHNPVAIFVTHAHPDHVAGLRKGASCPVYATPEAWLTMRRWPVQDRRVLPPRRPIAVAGLQIEAWPVEHATRAPAVGYRVSAAGVRIFYVPDIARLAKPSHALRDVDVYIGDGATIRRPLLRRRGSALIGHTTIVMQLRWCRIAGVRRAIFTHCGSGIVGSRPRDIEATIRVLGRAFGVDARVAHDGMTTVVRRTATRAER